MKKITTVVLGLSLMASSALMAGDMKKDMMKSEMMKKKDMMKSEMMKKKDMMKKDEMMTEAQMKKKKIIEA